MQMKPILFNTEMVKAILDGRKSVTRRVVKPPALDRLIIGGNGKLLGSFDPGVSGEVYPTVDDCTYHPGEILYVRETYFEYKGHYYYKADEKDETLDALLSSPSLKWRPSIHMPKEAARLFLRVTDVRVERLQSIRLLEILREGVHVLQKLKEYGYEMSEDDIGRLEYKCCWDSTIKKTDLPIYGWNANPWVWVIEFERISKEEAFKNA